MNISDIADISRGVRVVKKQLSSEGKYPVYQNCLSPMGYYEKYNREGNEAYIISAGAAGDVGYCENEFWAADDCFVFDNLIMVDNKYLFYWLVNNSDYFKRNVRKASIPRLSKTAIENMKIKIPSHIRQKETITILDKFYKLCNDISDGIPSEIEARQKQYEYYRDKLLTFKEKVV